MNEFLRIRSEVRDVISFAVNDKNSNIKQKIEIYTEKIMHIIEGGSWKDPDRKEFKNR